jgi:PKD repeat protein
LPAGQYSFLVKAVGKPTLLNHMSAAVNYTVAGTVSQPPVAKLAVTPASGIAPVTVTASTTGSTSSGGTIQSTQIDFGDGTVVTAAGASHAYSSAGTYTVTATATGSNGLTGTAQQKVTVTASKSPVVVLSVSPATGAAPLSVTASTAGSTAPNGSIASTSIDFGDGTVASAASASHVYSTAGSFTVKATVTDNVGAKGSAQTSVSITAAAPAPPAPVQSSGVAVTAPLSNSTVSNPVKFVASAKPASSIAKITAMKIYVDSVSKYSVNAASISTTLTLSSGSRHITVQAWDSTGAVYKNSFIITVK